MEGAADKGPVQSVFFKPQEVVVTDNWAPTVPMVSTPQRPPAPTRKRGGRKCRKEERSSLDIVKQRHVSALSRYMLFRTDIADSNRLQHTAACQLER